MQCQCILSYPSANAGNQCSHRARPGERFCGHHVYCANIVPPTQRSESSALRISRPSGTSRTGRLKRDNTAIRGIKMNTNMPPLSKKMLSVKGETGDTVRTRNRLSLLVWELLYNNGKRIREIIERYPDLIDRKSEYGTTPLLAAIFHGNMEAVRLLVTLGANVRNQGSVNGIKNVSPLGLSAIIGHLDMFRYLLSATTAKDAQSALVEYVGHDDRSMMSWDTVMASVPGQTAFTNDEVSNIVHGLRHPQSILLIQFIANKFPGIFNRKIAVNVWDPEVKEWLSSFGAGVSP
jgi:hypothetical protein